MNAWKQRGRPGEILRESIPIALKSKYLTATQIVLAVVGVLGATFHAFPIHAAVKPKEDWPNLDAVAIAWFALVVVAVLLPGITKLTFGGVSFEMKDEARASEQELETAIANYAALVQNWSAAPMRYIELLSEIAGDDARVMLLVHYLRDRMSEARAYVSKEPTDDVRIALWIRDPDRHTLEFFFSNERAPTKQSYSLIEGILGPAFLERRRFNEADLRNAALCVPVLIGDEAVGVLTADNKNAEVFTGAEEHVAMGLASQCALAIDQFRRAG